MVVDKDAYPDDIMFNSKCTDIKNMHLALKIDNDIKDFPIVWCGQPIRTCKGKHYWGIYRFYSLGDSKDVDDEKVLLRFRYSCTPETKLALVVYIIN